MDYGYENEVLFPLKLHVANGVKAGPGYAPRQGRLAGLPGPLHPRQGGTGCAEKCKHRPLIRPKTVQFPTPLFKRTFDRIPKPLPAKDKATFQPTPGGFRLTVETGLRETSVVFFPSDQDILDNPAPQKLTPTANPA
jgi:hypothetical protein